MPVVLAMTVEYVQGSHSAFILQEAVDEFTLVIHEILGGGGTKRHGCCDADESDLHAVKLLDDVGLEDQFAFLVEVAADIGERSLSGQFKETVHAVVKFMVAGDRDIVTDGVHDIDERFAGGHRADRFALDRVAVVNEQDIIVGREAFLHRIETGIAPALADAAVDIAGVQDDQVLFQRGSRVLRESGAAAEQQTEHQQETQQFFHKFSSSGSV